MQLIVRVLRCPLGSVETKCHPMRQNQCSKWSIVALFSTLRSIGCYIQINQAVSQRNCPFYFSIKLFQKKCLLAWNACLMTVMVFLLLRYSLKLYCWSLTVKTYIFQFIFLILLNSSRFNFHFSFIFNIGCFVWVSSLRWKVLKNIYLNFWRFMALYRERRHYSSKRKIL